ncbi:hypothetical protein B9Z19DRAFT_1102808 [Tuber borchii]|uniref:Riboflavin kinase n=1 Tax=Tuber borchii TaxID=42251 RepID=A0A2T6ZJN3_TUBBO|nr:hypothetical protein B9Z19DRAFT_1102808 [Tuber borchii]
MRAPATERPLTAGPTEGPEDPFPLRLSGPVIKGFGRGSKELQIPTANIPIDGLRVGGCETVESGVYYGYAGLDIPATTDDDESPAATATATATTATDSKVFPMVMSIGWNPFYKNSVRSVEVHIIHTFSKDFYGVRMNLVILGFIRPEFDYVSKEALIEDIKMDIRVGEKSLQREGYRKYRNDPYLTNFEC